MKIENIGQLIQHLASKAGVQADDKNLINILSNADLTKITVHSDLVKSIDENLLSLDAAMDNHPTIGSKYKAEALGGFDKAIKRILDDSGLPDDVKTEISAIRSTFQRFETLSTKLKEHFENQLAAAKKEGSKDGDKAALLKQIDDLNAQMRAEKQNWANEKAQLEAQRSADRLDFKMRTLLSGYKTTMDDMDADIRHTTLMTAINKKLQEHDAELKWDEKGELVPFKKDGSKLYGANNMPITLQSLIDTSLAQQKLLKTAEQQQQQHNQHQQQQQQQQQPVYVPGGGYNPPANGTNQAVLDMNLQTLAGIEAQQQQK
jgi:DNA-binding FrmR family transcriptional regulator